MIVPKFSSPRSEAPVTTGPQLAGLGWFLTPQDCSETTGLFPWDSIHSYLSSSPGFCLCPWVPALVLGFEHTLTLFSLLVSLCFNTSCLVFNPSFASVLLLTSFIHSTEAWPPTPRALLGSDEESCYPSGSKASFNAGALPCPVWVSSGLCFQTPHALRFPAPPRV